MSSSSGLVMEYFHNAGLYVLEGTTSMDLQPEERRSLDTRAYMETVDLTRLDRTADLGISRDWACR